MSLIVYNANQPQLFSVVDCEGYTLTPEQYERIGHDCGLGPYFAFFETYHDHIYRLRGPYMGKSFFYIIDQTGLVCDDKQKKIMKNIEREVKINNAKRDIRKATKGQKG